MVKNRISTFIKTRLSIGQRLSEVFYGIWMVTVVTGMVRASGEPTAESIRIMLFAALGVNITWGMIDGITYILSDLVDRTIDKGEATERPPESRLTRDDYEIALAILLIDFLTIFPVVLPYIIFDSIHLAMRTSQIVATGAFIIIGYTWAKYARMNRIKTALTFGLIGIFVIVFSYAFGW